MLQLHHMIKPLLNILIKFKSMIPIVGKGGMNLPQREVRMLILDFFGTPAIGLLIEHDVNHFRRSASNPWDTIFIDQDVFVPSLYYCHTITSRRTLLRAV